ncbi:MAG: transglutaminase domain-containing protein [Actinobacteria bacterium]|nr:transglutaminase domain-containing protein [Actinomycetota bacterium]
MLTTIALVGLRSVLVGSEWVVAGAAGVVVGTAAGWAISVRRLSPLAGFLVLLAAFVLGSGAADPDHAIAVVLPGPGGPSALIDGLVHSWKALVTTQPPVTARDGIGVIPYLMGFVGCSLGMVLARRTDQPLLPVLPATASLVTGLVLGTYEPVSLLVQGSMFGLVALLWGAVRSNREHRSIEGFYWPRIVSGAAMLMAVAAVGTVLAGSLPFTSSADRTVARQEIVPPFDLRDYASPLAGFRSYQACTSDDPEDERTCPAKATLFTVEGLPEGERVRLAVMDRYDGVVWSVGGSDASGSGRFERVGDRIADPPAGADADADVTFRVGAYDDVWIPTVGALVSVSFGGDDADTLSQAFRYNRRTLTAASPEALQRGDVIHLEVRVPEHASPDDLRERRAGKVDLPPLPDDERTQSYLGLISAVADDQIEREGVSTPYDIADTLARFMRDNGKYANKDKESGAPPNEVLVSGHSLAHLAKMVQGLSDGEEMIGDDEKYAALLATMLRLRDIPARVVIGFPASDAGSVSLTGDDLAAWVEVKFDGIDAWEPFYPTPKRSETPEKEKEENKDEITSVAAQVPPPDQYLEPPEDPETLSSQREQPPETGDGEDDASAVPASVLAAFKYVGPPVFIVASVVGLLLGAKVLRRRRRRTRGDAATRANGAWLEVVDYVRDLGVRPDATATRRELAMAASGEVEWEDGPDFASEVDAAMFGPDDPDDGTVDRLWTRLDEELRSLRNPLRRRQRIKAALSPTSLRRSGSVRRRRTVDVSTTVNPPPAERGVTVDAEPWAELGGQTDET